MMKISYTGCLVLSSAILAQFILKMCVAVRNRKKFIKTPLFWGFMVIQGHQGRYF